MTVSGIYTPAEKDVTPSGHGPSAIGCADVVKVSDIQPSLRSLFLEVYLDGVNEFGFHALPLFTTSIPSEDLPCVAQALADQDLGFGQQIFDEAEKIGHEATHSVVTRWTVSRDSEWGDEWELVGVDELLTGLICGTPDEQRLLQREALAEAPSSAEGVDNKDRAP